MLLDQETLRFVFGMKLRGLRLDKGLSLKDLAKKTGLSPSYLNEIEKGKKYPKTEKILILAEALNERHEDLISLELKKDLQLVQSLLDKKFLTGIPFDVFGIPASTVYELLAERPKKMRALVGTILEIARAHNIQTDDFLFALLRSYIDMHDNYFPRIEEAASDFRAKHGVHWQAPLPELKSQLVELLLKNAKIKVLEKDLAELSPDLSELLYFVGDKGRSLYLSKKVALKEQVFILARELGTYALGFKARPPSSLLAQLESFDQLFNHFSANYFASSLLIPEDDVTADLQALWVAPTWKLSEVEKLLEKYPASFESFFHRMTQILPRHFGLRNLFFLRYEYDIVFKKYEIARELHLSTPEGGPHRVKGNEHYCARWLIHRLTQEQQKTPGTVSLGAQRSRYADTENEYFILSVALQKPALPRKVTSVCIGILLSPEVEKKISWIHSPEIPSWLVGETCERCSVQECSERLAPLDPQLDPRRVERILKTLREF